MPGGGAGAPPVSSIMGTGKVTGGTADEMYTPALTSRTAARRTVGLYVGHRAAEDQVPYVAVLTLEYYPDWPKKGVLFCDVLPALRDPITFELLITHMMSHLFTKTLPRLAQRGQETRINYVVGLDARGFLLGPIIAQRLGAGFVPVRKRGKLPGTCEQATFMKEYGEDVFEMQKDAIPAGANVLVVDDLIATGGSAAAAGELVRKLGATTVEYLFIVAIPFLKGADKLDAPEYQYVRRLTQPRRDGLGHAPTNLVATIESSSAATRDTSCAAYAAVSLILYKAPSSGHGVESRRCREESASMSVRSSAGSATPWVWSVPSTSDAISSTSAAGAGPSGGAAATRTTSSVVVEAPTPNLRSASPICIRRHTYMVRGMQRPQNV